jgi:hypothetical protein
MKTNLIFSILVFEILCINMLNAQINTKPDYITSGYYQLVYEADIAYLEGNDTLAYVKLQAAENTCNLLNQTEYQEMELYSMLLLKNKDFGKAIYYMEKLATEYGKMPFRLLIKLEEDSMLISKLLAEYPAFYDSIIPAVVQKGEAFYYTPERELMITELTEMTKKDQNIRQNWETRRQQADYMLELKEIDGQNIKQFKEFVEKYGFPDMKLCGEKNIFLLSLGISAMILHFFGDGLDIQKIVLQNIQDGKCSPKLFGMLIDKSILEGKWEKTSLYGTWEGDQDNRIIDILHLDERRMAIGMPTREMERKRNKLLDMQND